MPGVPGHDLSRPLRWMRQLSGRSGPNMIPVTAAKRRAGSDPDASAAGLSRAPRDGPRSSGYLRRALEILILAGHEERIRGFELRVGVGNRDHLVLEDVVNGDDRDPVAVGKGELPE